MIKVINLLAAILIISTFKSACSTANTGKYLVYKIDSIENYYLIYARTGDSLFKIVSPKVAKVNCVSIALNQRYNFDLVSLLDMQRHGLNFSSNDIPHITGYLFADSTVIHIEPDSILDLWSSTNLKGLCYSSK